MTSIGARIDEILFIIPLRIPQIIPSELRWRRVCDYRPQAIQPTPIAVLVRNVTYEAQKSIKLETLANNGI